MRKEEIGLLKKISAFMQRLKYVGFIAFANRQFLFSNFNVAGCKGSNMLQINDVRTVNAQEALALQLFFQIAYFIFLCN
jgi:hypothetical protein